MLYKAKTKKVVEVMIPDYLSQRHSVPRDKPTKTHAEISLLGCILKQKSQITRQERNVTDFEIESCIAGRIDETKLGGKRFAC